MLSKQVGEIISTIYNFNQNQSIQIHITGRFMDLFDGFIFNWNISQ